MNALELLKVTLENSRGWTMGLLNDMKNEPFVQPTPNGGNHPIWVLGHIVRAESDLVDCFVQGKPNRFPELEEKFSMGTTPSANGDDYPSMDELCDKYDQMRAATLAFIDTLTEDDLDKPSHAPEEFGQTFGTVGACLSAIAIHTSFHGGQVADARRAAGRGPLMG